MGSEIIINDTLQITEEQGFPKELEIKQHLISPYKVDNFRDSEFEFKDKEGIRIYKLLPVRNFLVQNINGKWIYWGMIHVTQLTH